MVKSIYDKLRRYYPKNTLWEAAEFNPVFVLWFLKEVEHKIPPSEVYKVTEKAKQNLKYGWEYL